MLFLHPMWDNEAERIGKQRCTPTGYAIHVVAELIGFVGLLLIFTVLALLFWNGISGTFRASQLWMLAAPIGIGILSEFLIQLSWWLALRKGFRYDPERREASWKEAGERRTYPA